MELTPEDALRINVLLAGPVEAIRIHESRMTIHALSGKGEEGCSRIPTAEMNPTCAMCAKHCPVMCSVHPVDTRCT